MIMTEGDNQGLTYSTGNALLSTLEEAQRLAAAPLAAFWDQKVFAREKYRFLLARAKTKYERITKDDDDVRSVAHVSVCDRFAAVTVSCLPEVEAMLQISNDVGGGLGLALMVFLVRHLYVSLLTMDDGLAGSYPEEYCQIDAMMMRVIGRRQVYQDKFGGGDVAWISELITELESQRDHLVCNGMVELYLPDSIARLLELEGARVGVKDGRSRKLAQATAESGDKM
jgi:hypothetical protein